MTRRVLNVGQCSMDHGSISRLISTHFDAEVTAAHEARQTLELLRKETFDLVLVNRKLDRDHSDGLEIIRQMKADPALGETPVMLVTNYPEHQQTAVQAGAAAGFGKAELNEAATVEKLSQFLSPNGERGM